MIFVAQKSLMHDLNADKRNCWSTNSFKLLQKHVLCPIVCLDSDALIKIFLYEDRYSFLNLVFLSI